MYSSDYSDYYEEEDAYYCPRHRSDDSEDDDDDEDDLEDELTADYPYRPLIFKALSDDGSNERCEFAVGSQWLDAPGVLGLVVEGMGELSLPLTPLIASELVKVGGQNLRHHVVFT